MGECSQPLHVIQAYRVRASSFLACFHHRRTYIKHTRIHLIQQMFEGISKLWESAKMVDMYFQDKPLNAGAAAYHFFVTVGKFE